MSRRSPDDRSPLATVREEVTDSRPMPVEGRVNLLGERAVVPRGCKASDLVESVADVRKFVQEGIGQSLSATWRALA